MHILGSCDVHIFTWFTGFAAYFVQWWNLSSNRLTRLPAPKRFMRFMSFEMFISSLILNVLHGIIVELHLVRVNCVGFVIELGMIIVNRLQHRTYHTNCICNKQYAMPCQSRCTKVILLYVFGGSRAEAEATG